MDLNLNLEFEGCQNMSEVNQTMNVLQAMEPSMMALDDEAFVRQAYLRLLGRGADADGLSGYLQQLQQGVSRAEAYQALASSEEAQRYEARRQQMRRSLAVSAPMARSTAVMPAPTWWPAFAPVSWDGPASEVAHIHELLELDGADFVKAAYVALLGREADVDGGNNYLKRLRDGWSHMSVVKGLCHSDEGKAFGQKLPGLAKALQRYNKAQRRSWGGWYHRSVLGIESDLPMERHLRATHLALRQP
jgi:hypothetical protein